ncbi:hypothetical protein RA086_01460 [Lactiplantibacillus sp. WILCCON 0030]|uniref:Helicase ATP-binding domain-containing protein n=1 Tax=Lactiplantibacillus brownii TaxID=3069269 RepID=A0ABU1A5R8_9LACO|nr:hypothetical protein [Lactiplantibacillus brownii]MDQ7936319.1 hypothetical protein [Lactiplantibacillus brownii]
MDFLETVRLAPTQLVKTTRPWECFDELTHDAGYDYLRSGQQASLRQWYQRRQEHDLVSVMNAGAGKTLVGLLALQSQLNEHEGPGLYLCADQVQADYVTKLAQHYGLTVATMRTAEQPANALIVAAVADLVPPTAELPASQLTHLSMLVLDDALTCLQELQTALTWHIDCEQQVEWYTSLVTKFSQDADTQPASQWAALQQTAPVPLTLAVPYWTLARLQTEILGGPVKPPAWLTNLANVEVYVDQHGIDFQPHCLPIAQLPFLAQAQHRLFLMTSLAASEDLAGQLGLDESSLLNPITVNAPSDVGEKLIITPQQLDIQLDDMRMRSYLKYLFDNGFLATNLVILVPTAAAAIIWKKMGAKIYQAAEQASLMTDLATNQPIMAVVIGGYTELDLAAAASHCLVLDGLPVSNRLADQVALQRDPEAWSMINNLVRIVEQGLGRSVRSGADSSLIFILGNQLQALTVMPAIQALFSRRTQAQLQFSQKLGQAIKQTSQTASDVTIKLNQLIKAVLTRDGNWRTIYRQNINYNYRQLVQRTLTPKAITQAKLIYRADQQAMAGNFQQAVDLLKQLAQPTAMTLERLATYEYQLDPVTALKTQQYAYQKNQHLFRPAGMTYLPRSRPSLAAGQRLKSYLERLNFDNGNDLAIYFKARVTPLAMPNNFQTEDFQRAIAWIGKLIGFDTSRPVAEMVPGSTGFWRGSGTDIVLQLVTTTDTALNSASVQSALTWTQTTYAQPELQLVLMQAKRSVRLAPELVRQARVLTDTKVANLSQRVADLAAQLSVKTPSSWTAAELSQLLASEKLTMTDFMSAFTLPARQAEV